MTLLSYSNAILPCEDRPANLDAYYARLYGLTRDELRYTPDFKDVVAMTFPGSLPMEKQ